MIRKLYEKAMSFINLTLEKIVDENDKPIVYNDKIRVFNERNEYPTLEDLILCRVLFKKGFRNGEYYKNSSCCL